MSNIQSLCISSAIEGRDLFGKAKTGGGKTLAFLIPVIERTLRENKTNSKRISTLILSPTRELATQIGVECSNLLKFSSDCLISLTIFGGTKIEQNKKFLSNFINSKSACNNLILISTPGRLLDLMRSFPLLLQLLTSLSSLILDEADRLLDMGFERDINEILQTLDKCRTNASQQRQTLLFSATLPNSIKPLLSRALRSSYEIIETKENNEIQTHLHVDQGVQIVPINSLLPYLKELLDHFIQEFPSTYKIMVFFVTARYTQYFAQLFTCSGLNVLDIHSRKSQSQRTATSNQFRTLQSGILFSSDVSARGLDFPNVTHVVSIGLTEVEDYVHRIGRTGRAGKSGQGILVLSPDEFHGIKKLKGFAELNLQEIKPQNEKINEILQAGIAAGEFPSSFPVEPFHPLENPVLSLFPRSSSNVDRFIRTLQEVCNEEELATRGQQHYCAWLGYYNAKLKLLGWSKEKLVMNGAWIAVWSGLQEVPGLEPKAIGMMGLKGVKGVKLAAWEDRRNRNGGNRGNQQGNSGSHKGRNHPHQSHSNAAQSQSNSYNSNGGASHQHHRGNQSHGQRVGNGHGQHQGRNKHHDHHGNSRNQPNQRPNSAGRE
jgi:ATP-dependent RNA helicase MSS116